MATASRYALTSQLLPMRFVINNVVRGVANMRHCAIYGGQRWAVTTTVIVFQTREVD